MSFIRKLFFLFLAAMLAGACTTVPVTERSQLKLIPRGQILSLSADQYQQFLDKHDIVTGTAQSEKVKRVGSRIQQAVEKYFQERGQAEVVQGYAWEFNLIMDETINAFAMPGGKVVIFTGILSVANSEAGLATVMGHEIAHAVARHGNERMSQSLVAQLGGMALGSALNNRPDETRQLFMAA